MRIELVDIPKDKFDDICIGILEVLATNKTKLNFDLEKDLGKSNLEGVVISIKDDSKTVSTKKKKVKKKYKPHVSMTEEEYQKLIDDFGEETTLEKIEDLNNYKGSRGRRYKSDYLALRSWIRREAKEKKPKNEPKNKLNIDFSRFREN